ncbi:MAG: cytochrome c [Chitinophagaceae bacterium]|nr:MAG: cytochrome c [Chitinophagaceae bacterium]
MMTKKLLILTGVIGVTAALISCGDHRNPGRAYMPDMTYSRAYETYAPTGERLANSEVEGGNPYFNGKPVAGTIARGDMAQYLLPNDSAGYAASATVRNPLDPSTVNLKEAERLYLINCGICHGTKLDGNGPLYNDGNGPYGAAPKNLVSDEIKQKGDGTIFHVITYGKGQMGSYASQLTTKQRWMIVDYIRAKQGGGGPAAATDSTGAKGTSGNAAQVGSNGSAAATTGMAADSSAAPKK